ncbi:Glycosyltransferase, catalytic subunit of cellulose synthase and poly-beta-1,6-N-acetylglucosamine synthase [Filimonas lacunae]|uniref:Glycosyltransferase, catalytic subunit of cellulose synthase and poly-beta-1,6-N-acetylglucosamine synthase n=1 Tax=Filimonas lacunae TaxID=477680 RepID=A0A173MJT9_9BACT|nr:glycosyltransferase [Filimonas lacunae]BAV07902.1 hypothetical protein FLA_3933 [Filimonas lacunae]SIT06262.1 Glycosyltransferase, catalytic subunit of cellulose synthase and poly-beta-1,6-N-acetylglucosamine synthase [Filimonas lacunae]
MLHKILDYITLFYESVIFFYCMVIFSCYSMLAILSFVSIRRHLWRNSLRNSATLVESPLMPGISVIAPAYNEEATIACNARSLLSLNYSRFEVIIVNDGSTDNTLQLLIDQFSLVEVSFAYHAQLPSMPVKGFYKSVNAAYARLLVLDKENGKCKADAVNAGINVASYTHFLNTDVDCILHDDTLLKLAQPFVDEDKRVIATGATLRMANSCRVNQGQMVEMRAPTEVLPRFQEIEYTRSYLLGKMGWSLMNAVNNVSGGLGLFDKEIAIKAGGYDSHSFAEDMDIVVRMSKYMHEHKLPFAIRYIPETLCWTEGPATLKVFGRQRTRWGRGILQIFTTHRGVLFNPRFGKMGLFTFPYVFFFEMLAPVIEFSGIVYFLYHVFFSTVNWEFAAILLVFVYIFSVFITNVALLWDQLTFRHYRGWRSIIGLCITAFAEPFIYHPLSLFFTLKGYLSHITGRKHTWGNMQRRGFQQQAPVTFSH